MLIPVDIAHPRPRNPPGPPPAPAGPPPPAGAGGGGSLRDMGARRLLATVLLLAAGCGASPDEPPAADRVPPVLDEIGEGEGSLRLVATAGYVEDGASDHDVDWVTPFEERTG